MHTLRGDFLISRYLWLALGLLAVGLAFAGIFLPLLPTTPFLLLAAYAFARSSPRLQRWLHEHPVFGPLIENWRRNGAIDRRSKRVAIACIAIMPPLSWALGIPVLLLIIQIVVLGAVATFILTRPDGAADPEDTRDSKSGE